METPRPQWSDWAKTLQHLKLDSLTAWLLDAGAPLTLLSAQALYFSSPILGRRTESLARLLEDESETRAFAEFLREEARA